MINGPTKKPRTATQSNNTLQPPIFSTNVLDSRSLSSALSGKWSVKLFSIACVCTFSCMFVLPGHCAHACKRFINAKRTKVCEQRMGKRNVFSCITSMFTFWMLFSLSFADVAITQSQEVAIGVNVGDWTRYGDIMAEWNSTDPNANPSQEISELENTVWFENVVVNIYYGQINFRQTVQFVNDTQKVRMLQVDLYNGLGNDTFMFAPAGLSEGDPLYEYSIETYPIWINETISRTYIGAMRVVNHISLTVPYFVEGDPPQNLLTSISYYWDKETGVLTERYGSFNNHTGGFVTSWLRSDRIVETNLWGTEDGPSTNGNGTDGFPYAIVAVILAVAILIAAWILRMNAKKRKLKTKKSRKRHARARFSR